MLAAGKGSFASGAIATTPQMAHEQAQSTRYYALKLLNIQVYLHFYWFAHALFVLVPTLL